MTTHLVIDCDPGVDDAMAITIALHWPSVQLEAITCVGGNTSLDNVLKNALSVLKVNKRKVPVYPGSRYSLLRRKHTAFNSQAAEAAHGANGFGDVAIDLDEKDWDNVQKEHAAVALCRLARENKKQITLVALAPLTNVAMAMRLDPEFSENLKEMVIMGGNYMGPGTEMGGAEFNFYMDTDAADIVLREANCPVTVIPFDCCEASSNIPWPWFHEVCARPGLAPQGHLLRDVVAVLCSNWPCFDLCDAVAMVAALNRASITSCDSHKHLAVNIESDPEVADGGYGFLLHDKKGGEQMQAKLLFPTMPGRTIVKVISTDEIKRRIEAALFN